MLADFLTHVRAHEVPVSIREYLTLLEALQKQVIPPTIDAFYHLARLTLVKDESHFDRFDRAFSSYFQEIEKALPPDKEIPLDWLLNSFESNLTPEQKAAIEKLGWDKLMEEFRKRLEEQTERHAGGNRWIGTGGTSPFGHSGYHPEGIRVGGESRNRSAVKVWERREFRDYDSTVELGTRNIKIALRRLRRFAREGTELELDLDGTIDHTARNAGYLDIQMVAERRNAVKVLMLLDVGGSMDDHVSQVEELFSAASSEFKNLEVYYFHNCVYEHLWRNNRRRHTEKIATFDVLHRYNPDWRLILVGDATMSPYEITHPGGSIEFYNNEPGAVWLQRLTQAFPHFVWLNPEPQGLWEYRQSIALIRELMHNRMYPVTIAGLEQAMQLLAK